MTLSASKLVVPWSVPLAAIFADGLYLSARNIGGRREVGHVVRVE